MPENFLPEFGKKLDGPIYLPRPGAYALLGDEHGRLAVIQVGQRYFLPGGGQEPGETPQEALRREVLEECGYSLQMGPRLGEAREYLYAAGEETYYQIQAVFYAGHLGQRVAESCEPDHRLAWLEATTAIHRLHSRAQAWTVQRYFTERADK